MNETDLHTLLSTPTRPAIVIHGGAWVRDATVHPEVLAGVAQAARIGFEILAAGGSALDAVEAAVVAMEEDPTFNAGYGSGLTSDGTVEMDASIMVGETLEAGAVAGVSSVRNPIRLARRVMTHSGHLLLASEGALRFAREVGVEIMPPDWHVTPQQRARSRRTAPRSRSLRASGSSQAGDRGAVAVDVHGHVAAATSTGGTVFKRPGRIGDSPLIGAGNYADDVLGAVSCTGHGESIIKLSLARWACDAIERGQSPQDAAEAATVYLRQRVKGDGGLIIAGADGRCGWAMNTPKMSRAFLRAGMTEPLAMV